MKKVIFCFFFALCATLVMANNTEPVKMGRLNDVKSENVPTLESKKVNVLEGCTYCGRCNNVTVCVTCTCNNCDAAINALYVALCSISDNCCYGTTPPPKN
jgi:hypothetical protein